MVETTHPPDHQLAQIVLPQKIRTAVAFKVARAITQFEPGLEPTSALLVAGAVHLPDLGLTTGVPRDIRAAVADEVIGRSHRAVPAIQYQCWW